MMRSVAAVLALTLAACQPMQVGVAHTHHGTPAVQHWPDVPLHVVHLMGWGTDNPNPAPGRHQWQTLDARINTIVAADAEPVLVLCCAPDWMKGGAGTDWRRLEEAPHRRHFDDFAALAAAAAARYPDVTRFAVWNELKGFHDPASNAWDMAAYTDLYNEVHAAIKAVRPDALIGGPYAPVVAWSDPATMSHPSAVTSTCGTVDQRSLDAITYWLTHNVGADFVALSGWTATVDRGWTCDPADAGHTLAAVTEWVRARTDLPVWWMETHTVDGAWPLWAQRHAATAVLDQLAAAGAAVAVLWEPQGGDRCVGCLWWADGTLTPLGVHVIEEGP